MFVYVRTASAVAALAAMLPVTPAHAHHPGSGGNVGGAGPINTISASTLGQGESSFAVMLEVVKMATYSNAQLVDFASRHIHAHSVDTMLAPSLSYAYGLSRDLTVSLRLPYLVRTDIRTGEHAHGSGGSVSNTALALGDADGMGDLTALATWRFLDDRAAGTAWALLFGGKAPTGITDRRGSNGEVLEAEFQPGSGSWDGLVGLAATKRVGNWSFDASALYTVATTGAQDTNLGDSLQYGIAVSWRMMGATDAFAGRMNAGTYIPTHARTDGVADTRADPHREALPGPAGPALDLVIEINGEWHAKEKIGGVEEANSGGSVVYLAPGLRLSSDRWSGFVSVGVPILNDPNGAHADSELRVVTGFAMGF